MKIAPVAIVAAFASLYIAAPLPTFAESDGKWSCKLNDAEWKNDKGGASLNAGQLSIYSGDDRIDGIFIMMSKAPAMGSFSLNDSAQASFSDAAGANHKSKAGSGTLVISKFLPPQGETKGKLEGTFSAEFESGASKQLALKDCSFSLPVKNL